MAPTTHSAAYTAVVSGASGFIGTELVKQLLEKGYTVRGTVRSTSNKEKTQHLTQLAEVGGTCPVLHASLCKQARGFEVFATLRTGSPRDFGAARGRPAPAR